MATGVVGTRRVRLEVVDQIGFTREVMVLTGLNTLASVR